jgi:hypothetical protein
MHGSNYATSYTNTRRHTPAGNLLSRLSILILSAHIHQPLLRFDICEVLKLQTYQQRQTSYLITSKDIAWDKYIALEFQRDKSVYYQVTKQEQPA